MKERWTCPICKEEMDLIYKEKHITIETKEIKEALNCLKEI